MDFSIFFIHPSSLKNVWRLLSDLGTPHCFGPWWLFAWGRGVPPYLSAISISISTIIHLHSLRSSSNHISALPASFVHLPAFTAVIVLNPLGPTASSSVPRWEQHMFPHLSPGAGTLSDPLSVLDGWPPLGGIPDSNKICNFHEYDIKSHDISSRNHIHEKR